jgi:hypothetical protein
MKVHVQRGIAHFSGPAIWRIERHGQRLRRGIVGHGDVERIAWFHMQGWILLAVRSHKAGELQGLHSVRNNPVLIGKLDIQDSAGAVQSWRVVHGAATRKRPGTRV